MTNARTVKTGEEINDLDIRSVFELELLARINTNIKRRHKPQGQRPISTTANSKHREGIHNRKKKTKKKGREDKVPTSNIALQT